MKQELQNKILVPVITPYKEDGSVNYEALKKHVRFVLDCGADGIYPGGSSAECFLMNDDEREKVMETCIDAADGAFVVANVSAIGSHNTERFARHAEKKGADVISSVPPFYYGYKFDEVKAFYNDLANSVNIPTMIYNFGSGFSAAQFDSLLSNEKIKYIKYTATDYYTMEQICSHSDVWVYSGKDECFLSALAQGADGGIGTSFNYMVKKFIEIQKLFKENKMAEALKVQHACNEVIRITCEVGLLSAVKYCTTVVSGNDVGSARRPFFPLTDDAKKRLEVALEENGMLN